MKILLTGATGNVGLAILNAISFPSEHLQVYAGVRNLATDQAKLEGYPVTLVTFDFENVETFHAALSGIEILFLLRPPQLADVSKFFEPLIRAAVACNIKQIVFLSVQGVENSRIIPHHKIEQLILDSGIDYTFLRPAYFMQNFTTTLRADLINKQRIYLPAGNAKFTVIDVGDIGAVAAKILSDPLPHIGEKYALTNRETLTFGEMAQIMSRTMRKEIKYISPNLWQFYWAKRRENVPSMLVLVMIMLHYLPRFQKIPKTTEWVERITGHVPKSFEAFVSSNRAKMS